MTTRTPDHFSEGDGGDLVANHSAVADSHEALFEFVANSTDAFGAGSKYQAAYERTHSRATKDMVLKNQYPAWLSVGKPESDIEKRALYAAENFAPTPDNLGREGCMAAISKWIVGPMLLEQDNRKAYESLIHSGAAMQSGLFMSWFKANDLGSITVVPQGQISAMMLRPGDIIIGKKRDGSQHAMVVTRIPSDWGAVPEERAFMLVGNTGMDLTTQDWFKEHPDGTPPYPHFHLMQEVIGAGTEHFNRDHGQLSSSRDTNPYLGGNFYILRFRSN